MNVSPPPYHPPTSASAATHKKQRQKLRRKMLAEGRTEQEIAEALAAKAEEQRKGRAGFPWEVTKSPPKKSELKRADADRVHSQTWDELRPDDTGYRTNKRFNVKGLTTKQQAQALKKGRTLTRYEYERSDRP